MTSRDIAKYACKSILTGIFSWPNDTVNRLCEDSWPTGIPGELLTDEPPAHVVAWHLVLFPLKPGVLDFEFNAALEAAIEGPTREQRFGSDFDFVAARARIALVLRRFCDVDGGADPLSLAREKTLRSSMIRAWNRILTRIFEWSDGAAAKWCAGISPPHDCRHIFYHDTPAYYIAWSVVPGTLKAGVRAHRFPGLLQHAIEGHERELEFNDDFDFQAARDRVRAVIRDSCQFPDQQDPLTAISFGRYGANGKLELSD